MKITLESTAEIVHANGLPVRMWQGHTESGAPVIALITRVGVSPGPEADAMARELAELSQPPTNVVDSTSELVQLHDRLATIVDEAFGPHPVSTVDELLTILEREHHAQRIRLVNQVSDLERQLREAWTSLSRAGAWLIKDFRALYRAAEAEVSETESPMAIAIAETGLRGLLQRLRPAFDVCESERLGAPGRLTSGESLALVALHRWLHSPGGDGDLTESSALFHEQLEAEDPSACDRLDAEEERAYREAVTDFRAAELAAKSQREKTEEGLEAVVAECGFDLGVLVSVVRRENGGVRLECALEGSGPPTLGRDVAKLIREAADNIERGWRRGVS